jgi:hypothetical protein
MTDRRVEYFKLGKRQKNTGKNILKWSLSFLFRLLFSFLAHPVVELFL